MPCDTRYRVTLELKNASIDLLRKAVEQALKEKATLYDDQKTLAWYGGGYNRDTGILTVRNAKEGNAIKRAYSEQMVRAQAQRFGWQVKSLGNNKYEVIKR